MSFQRDHNDSYFPNSYRPSRSCSRSREREPSRWEKERLGAPRTASDDYSPRDRDRERHYERDRDRIYDRDLDLTRTRAYTSRDQPAMMDPDKASAEIVKALRQISDLLTQKTQLSQKKDIELKAYHKRKQDYERQISKPIQFPAVQDSFQKHQNHHKQNLAVIEKDLATLAPKEDAAFGKFAQTLVKGLPIDGIKALQPAKAGQLKSGTTSSQVAQDERLQKLEQRQIDFEASIIKQLASLKATQDAQASELARYKEEEKLRSDLKITAEKENEHVRKQLSSQGTQITNVAKRLESVESLGSPQVYVEKKIACLKAEINKSLEQVKLGSTKNAARDDSYKVQYDTLLRETSELRQKYGKLSKDVEALKNTFSGHKQHITGLESDIKNHKRLLANIDVKGLENAKNRLLEYPDFTALNNRIAGQDAAIDEIKSSVACALAKTPQNIPADLPTSFRAWSDRFLKIFGTKLDEHTAKIKRLECSELAINTVTRAKSTTASSPDTESTRADKASLASESEAVVSRVTSAESRLSDAESKISAYDSKVFALQDAVNALQTIVSALQDSNTALGSQAEQRYCVLETMIESLSSQWNNMNTTQMAQVILGQLSRLQPTQLVPELVHFQERLADVEKLVKEDGEQRKSLTKGIQSICDNIANAPKRSLASEAKDPGHQEKRARIEGANAAYGYNNNCAYS